MQAAYGIPYDYSEVIDQNGIIRYKGNGVQVNQIQTVIESLLTTRVTDPARIPRELQLEQNFPNPFNSSTRIRFVVKHGQHLNLTVYDATGTEVRTLAENEIPAGPHEFVWDGRDQAGRMVASGIYIYMIKGENLTQSRKMILLR